MSLFDQSSSSKEGVPAKANNHDTMGDVRSVTQPHPPQVVRVRRTVNNPYAKATSSSSSSSSSSVAVHRTTIKANNPYLRHKRTSVPVPASATMAKVRTPNVSGPIHNNSSSSSNSASFRMDNKDGNKVLGHGVQTDTRNVGLSDIHRNHHHNTSAKHAPPPPPITMPNHASASANAKQFSNETPVWKRLASHPTTPPSSSSQSQHVHNNNNIHNNNNSNPYTTHTRPSKSLRPPAAAAIRPCRTSLLGKKRKLVVSTKGGGGLGATAPSNLGSSSTSSSTSSSNRNSRSLSTSTTHNRVGSLSDRTRILRNTGSSGAGSVDKGASILPMGLAAQPCVAIQIGTSDMLRGSVVGDYLMIVGDVRTVTEDIIRGHPSGTLLERMALELTARRLPNKGARTDPTTPQAPPPPPQATTTGTTVPMESSSMVPGTDTRTESCHEEQDANESFKSSSSLVIGQETELVGLSVLPKNNVGRTGFYVQARILRNANGTNMNLLDQALRMRRTYLEQSSHTTTRSMTEHNSPNHNSAPPEKKDVSTSPPSTSTKIHSIFETNIIL
eukprot:scaffold49991_cov60-Attheya_sp.AAC.2